MIGIAILGAYLLGWFLAARRAVTYIVEHEGGAEDDRVDQMMLTAAGCLAALLWPLWLPVFLVMATRRPTSRELKARLRARDERIAELERDLGIGRQM